MISNTSHDSSEGEQWGRYNLPRFLSLKVKSLAAPECKVETCEFCTSWNAWARKLAGQGQCGFRTHKTCSFSACNMSCCGGCHMGLIPKTYLGLSESRVPKTWFPYKSNVSGILNFQTRPKSKMLTLQVPLSSPLYHHYIQFLGIHNSIIHGISRCQGALPIFLLFLHRSPIISRESGSWTKIPASVGK